LIFVLCGNAIGRSSSMDDGERMAGVPADDDDDDDDDDES
jgi:hypothetical protein